MKTGKVGGWASYEVYEKIDNNHHTLALCDEFGIAKAIAIALAKMDPKGDSYYITSVDKPNTLVPGGGWYFEYYVESGELKERGLS